jgi:two-component system sporulation sensor kinase A
MNSAAERVFKRSREDVQGKVIWEEFAKLSETRFYHKCLQALNNSMIVQVQDHLAAVGHTFDLTLSPYMDGLCIYLRKLALANIKIRSGSGTSSCTSTQDHLRLVYHSANLGIWEWDSTNRVLHASDELKSMLGLSESSWFDNPMTLLNRIHCEDREMLLERVKSAAAGTPVRLRLRYLHPNGETRYWETVTEWIADEPVETRRCVGTTRDVTDAVSQEQRLRQSEALYELISQNSQDVISLSTPDGRVFYVSPSVYNLLGYRPEEIIGRERSFFYHPTDHKNVIIPSGKNTHVAVIRVRHKDKHYMWFEVTSKLIRNERGEVVQVLGIGRDMTQRIAAEELVFKSEKLSMAGQLAAGIAHEIRNPLTAIKGFLQLFDSGYSLKKEHVQVMSSELMRIEGILNELLLLAKPHEMNFVRNDVNRIVRQVATLMETEAIMKNIVLCITLAEQELVVDCDENQLKQVFINLIKNGMESMAQGGRLTISSACTGEAASITFVDHGSGMTPEQLERIGQPFFTTKSGGTGLGLTVSLAIIENHKGMVLIKSEPGQGTSFVIEIPLSSAE